mmetsp:Transcript_53921/g.136208  ORF Transcript_53921/g.136208 Transcript_53921/m.136208 type:complete len:204 (+) Transcript_53921:958-1569(+)
MALSSPARSLERMSNIAWPIPKQLLIKASRQAALPAECASLIQTGKKNSKPDLFVLCRRPPSYASLERSSPAVAKFFLSRLTPTPSMASVYSFPVAKQQMFLSTSGPAGVSLLFTEPPASLLAELEETSDNNVRKASILAASMAKPAVLANARTRAASPSLPRQMRSSRLAAIRCSLRSLMSSSSRSSSTAPGFFSQNRTADW